MHRQKRKKKRGRGGVICTFFLIFFFACFCEQIPQKSAILQGSMNLRNGLIPEATFLHYHRVHPLFLYEFFFFLPDFSDGVSLCVVRRVHLSCFVKLTKHSEAYSTPPFFAKRFCCIGGVCVQRVGCIFQKKIFCFSPFPQKKTPLSNYPDIFSHITPPSPCHETFYITFPLK